MYTIRKLLPVLLAGTFCAGVLAQAVTTRPGEAMGPTGTGATSSGTSPGSAMPRDDAARGHGQDPAVTLKPGDAMGPTGTSATDAGNTRSVGQGASAYRKGNTKPDAAVTINPGEAMGPAGTSATSAGPKQ